MHFQLAPLKDTFTEQNSGNEFNTWQNRPASDWVPILFANFIISV